MALGTLVLHFYILVPPIIDPLVGTINFVYHTVKYSNSAYFLCHALVDTHPLHTCILIYSTTYYGMRLIYKLNCELVYYEAKPHNKIIHSYNTASSKSLQFYDAKRHKIGIFSLPPVHYV